MNNFNQYNNENNAIIKIIGVGGGGCNAVDSMIKEGVSGVDFYVINTDSQVLNLSPAKNKLLIGKKSTKGFGAGSNPELGKIAAIESEVEIRQFLLGADLVFIAAGMGGGTGTGAAPIVARIAMELGILVVAIVTKPFRFEGTQKTSIAMNGIIELRKYVDSIITISNDSLQDIIGDKPLNDAFYEADSILKSAVQTITNLIRVPQKINIDFADIRNILKEKGKVIFGVGYSSGPDAALDAVNQAIRTPYIESTFNGITDAIVNVTSGREITLIDINNITECIRQATDTDTNINFGISIDQSINNEIVVAIIGTAIDHEYLEERKALKKLYESKKIKKFDQKSKEDNFKSNENYSDFNKNKAFNPFDLDSYDDFYEVDSELENDTFKNNNIEESKIIKDVPTKVFTKDIEEDYLELEDNEPEEFDTFFNKI